MVEKMIQEKRRLEEKIENLKKKQNEGFAFRAALIKTKKDLDQLKAEIYIKSR